MVKKKKKLNSLVISTAVREFASLPDITRMRFEAPTSSWLTRAGQAVQRVWKVLCWTCAACYMTAGRATGLPFPVPLKLWKSEWIISESFQTLLAGCMLSLWSKVHALGYSLFGSHIFLSLLMGLCGYIIKTVTLYLQQCGNSQCLCITVFTMT